MLVAFGVKKVISQPATEVQEFKFNTGQRKRKTLTLKKTLLSPT